MVSFEAFVNTSRADRYVEQFSRHFVHQPGGITARSDVQGQLLINVGGGTCLMRAEPDGLALRVDGPDAEAASAIKRKVGERVEQVGRREGLVVRWRPAAEQSTADDRGTRHEEP
jgi:hypothetical protein